jgi:hypothetical protein
MTARPLHPARDPCSPMFWARCRHEIGRLHFASRQPGRVVGCPDADGPRLSSSGRRGAHPQKMPAGSRLTSSISSSMCGVGSTRSYSWNLRCRWRQYNDHSLRAFV